MRVPKFPLRKRLLAPDGFTSVNRVLLLLLFCTGEAVLNLVRRKLLYLNDNTLFNEQENVHFVCIFKSGQTVIVSPSSLHLMFYN